MESSLSALADALTSISQTSVSAYSGSRDLSDYDFGSGGDGDEVNPEVEAARKRMVALKAQQLEDEMLALREYFVDVTNAKDKVDKKVFALENFGSRPGMSNAKQFVDESNQRTRAMV
jgi:hypothetical protein